MERNEMRFFHSFFFIEFKKREKHYTDFDLLKDPFIRHKKSIQVKG